MAIDNLKFWLRPGSKLAWVRGVLAGLAVLSFAPKYIPYDQRDILRAAHAAIFGWNELSHLMGELIGKIPYLPALSASTINFILIYSTIIGPAWLALYMDSETFENRSEEKLKITAILLGALLGVPVFSIFVQSEIHGTSVLYWGCSFVFLLLALVHLPNYRAGFISLLSFLLVLELLYIANLPIIKSSIDAFACRYDLDEKQKCN